MNLAASLNVARLGVVDYTAALELQDALVAARSRDAIGDTLLLLEHPHVYTLGRAADATYITNASESVPVYRVSRGGQVTYHGPGQLVGYPIVKLAGIRRDVSRYLRNLERALIAALRDFDIAAARRDGMTGVWAEPGKIASIGVGIRRWVTLHGFALNVTTDLAYFDAIVPCGIEGCQMTSIAALGHPEATVTAFADTLERAFAATFEYDRVSTIAPDRLRAILESAPADRRSFALDCQRIEGPETGSRLSADPLRLR
jgi:lipoyl(octanoyl) transferase